MEIHNKLNNKLKLIHDLEYEQLVEVLLNIEVKKEISKSLYDNHNKGSNQKTQGHNESSKIDVYKKMPCHRR